MDFSFTDEQQELAALARRILEDNLSEERMRAVESDADRFDPDLYRQLADAGITGVALPVSLGGGGLGLIELCRVLIELGRTVAPVPVLSSVVSAMAVAAFGSDAHQRRYASPVAMGDLILAAAVQEDLNLEPMAPVTRAERSGDGWRVTGTKTVVQGGTVADAFLVPAMTEAGVAVFIVDKDAATVTRQTVTNKDADAVVELDGATAEMLGDVAQGADIVRFLVRHLTVGLCAMQLGVCEKALELTAEYSKVRVQFDRPIATFQAVGQRLAEGYIDVEGIRLTLWQAAWRLAEGLDCDQEIDSAKFWASDGGHRIAHTTVHIHGGMGIDLDYHAHRYFVGAKRIEFVLGTATDHLRTLGASLAAEPA